MRFEEHKFTFQEANHRYVALKRQYEAGTIGDEEFDAQLKRLMVLDDEGRWWGKSRGTGEWHYKDGHAWVKGTPPGYQPDRATVRASLSETTAEVGQVDLSANDTRERREHSIASQTKLGSCSEPEKSSADGRTATSQRGSAGHSRWLSHAKRWLAYIATSAAGLVLVGVVIYFLSTSPVPVDVEGMTLAEAAEEISGTGWELHISGFESDYITETPEGTIGDQIPNVNERSGDKSIGVYISQSTDRVVEVPDVSGLSESQADKVLTEAGLEIYGYPEVGRNGEILATATGTKVTGTDPPAGTEVSAGTLIDYETE